MSKESEMTEVTATGRVFLLDLARWFDMVAQFESVQVAPDSFREAAERLREIAAAGEMREELERWYQEVGRGE